MNLKQHIAFVCIIGIFSLNIWSCKEKPKEIKQTEVSFKKEGELTIFKTDATTVKLDIEIADTEYDIQTGLMYRSTMLSNRGMLFVFDNEEIRYFYMKNTKIPLDLIYIGSDKRIVSFQKNAKPFDESSLSSKGPAQYVLEVNAGLVDSWGLVIGERVSFPEQ
ncbi:MAG: DUF192 domain-containing protein [Flavobacteriaceae bacterium]